MFRLISAIGLAAALASLVAAPLSADFSKDSWKFFKPIVLPQGLTNGALVEVSPDAEVFANAAPLLWDLRVVEVDSLQEVPYKLLVEQGEQRRSFIYATVRDLGHVPGQYTSFVADLGKEGILHNELEIQTPTRNFQRRLVVEGSSDSKTWAILQEKGQIYDFTIQERHFTQRYVRVQYPASTARYLRVRILNDGEPPLDVTGAMAYSSQELPPRVIELAAAIVKREENPVDRKTIVVLDMGSQGFPTSQLSLDIPQQNFYRQVSLEGSNDSDKWTLLQGAEAVYAYNTPKFVGSKLSIGYPESAYSFYRLTIFNEDNPPLAISGARTRSYLRRLIFAASPDKTYRLYYGNLGARTPSYELERIFPYLVTENLPVAQLGAHVSNTLFTVPPEPPKPFTERNSWLLPTAVALAGVLIGLLLANLLRQIKKVLPPPTPGP
ncbi:MAG: DUF3999 family protein [Chloroflexi bacterium]|nr:DUF3999 family protein [Chloroflexota bacterium]